MCRTEFCVGHRTMNQHHSSLIGIRYLNNIIDPLKNSVKKGKGVGVSSLTEQLPLI